MTEHGRLRLVPFLSLYAWSAYAWSASEAAARLAHGGTLRAASVGSTWPASVATTSLAPESTPKRTHRTSTLRGPVCGALPRGCCARAKWC